MTRLDPATTPSPITADPAPALDRSLGLALGALRLGLGWILLWAGLDKLIGLGYSTPGDQGVLDGASATRGYLEFGLNPDGPAYTLFSNMAGNPLVDALYLAGTLGAGLALMLGVAVRPAAAGAVLLMVSLWLSALPLEHNPFFDEHLLYALAAVVLAVGRAGDRLGLGHWWRSLGLVRRNPWLA